MRLSSFCLPHKRGPPAGLTATKRAELRTCIRARRHNHRHAASASSVPTSAFVHGDARGAPHRGRGRATRAARFWLQLASTVLA
eukprot:1691763-Pleurochrysis_carterae.AAC.1